VLLARERKLGELQHAAPALSTFVLTYVIFAVSSKSPASRERKAFQPEHTTHRMMMLPAVLDDVKVLDLSQGVAGPLCAKILADFGADVVKIEPLRGDSARYLAPHAGNDPHPEKSLVFLLANLNKRGVRLDLEHEEGRELLLSLVRNTDLVVESFKPGYLASLGLDYESLARENPSLIMVSITPFGQTGAYSGYESEEIVTYAMSGIMSISGTADREPLKHGGMQAQYEGGLNGGVAALAALYSRDLTGEGQHVDISLQEVVTSTLVIHQPFYTWAGAVQGRRQPSGLGYGQVQPCQDGYFVWQTGGGAEWEEIAEFFGHAELKDERFSTVTGRALHAADLDRLVLDATKDRTMAELFRTASEKYHMLFGIVQQPEDLAQCPHLDARGFFHEVDHPVIGRIKVPFRLWSMSDSPAAYRRPAPLLGQHNAEIYGEELGLDADRVASLAAAGVI
jgi:crotonobetainyl-CoA:carnitine CoA-transferase CaiB-like acyl-CoA transferase